jgi:hypothetical protein
MSDGNVQFELPRAIETLLATLSKLYEQEGQRRKQEIIVNARVRVHEGWTYDNWNGGTYGHALYLAVPENLYLASVRQKADLESEIAHDLNKMHNFPREYVDTILLEVEPTVASDWRRESGLLQRTQRTVTAAAVARIWNAERYRVFLSHKAGVKCQVGLLKAKLSRFGVDCFVAHEDIEPTREWQSEIESALATMDAFVALLTEDFHDSDWTDQEVGFALGRGIPMISVSLGKAPYGFIGRFQALACNWDDAPLGILRLLAKEAGMVEAFVVAVEGCSSWDHGLISAFNGNAEVGGSFGFSGAYPGTYGQGLAYHLARVTGRGYEVTAEGQVQATT